MPHTDYHVAFFTNTYLPFVSGVSRSVHLYYEHLKALGNRLVIYAPQYNGSLEDNEDVRRILSLSNFNNTEFSLPLVSTKPVTDFQYEGFDIVHVHHPFLLGETGLNMARRDKVPLIFTYHTQYEKYTHYVPIGEDTAVRTILKHANDFCNMCDLVIAPTRDVKKQLRQRGVTSRIDILPSGIEQTAYAAAKPEAARESLGIGPEQPILLYVGRLAHEKNLKFLVGAALKALEQRPDAVFVLAGSGKHENELKDQASADKNSQVRFVGTVTGEDLINLYTAANVFLFASTTETQGMVLVEAMAGATPVVARDADAVRDVVVDNVNGRLLRADATEEEFADAILHAINGEEAAKWSAGARETAQAYDMPKLAAKLQRKYRALKLEPRHRLKSDTMSFGLIQSYFSTVWENFSRSFSQI
ncbi:MAG: glycosyltransferase [Candidatus Hydrogenedentes bacterium]|nr:glycosyltransferase [Candidatus Hydrogenedentota bacterium]